MTLRTGKWVSISDGSNPMHPYLVLKLSHRSATLPTSLSNSWKPFGVTFTGWQDIKPVSLSSTETQRQTHPSLDRRVHVRLEVQIEVSRSFSVQTECVDRPDLTTLSLHCVVEIDVWDPKVSLVQVVR